MILKKKLLPVFFGSAAFLLTGHYAFAAKPITSITAKDANTPTALGGGMYLMKSGGMWGSVMHLDEPHKPHPGEPAPAKSAKKTKAEKTDPKAPKKPDLCVASDQNQTLILRASANGLEVRSVGKEWNLQKDILTSVNIAVGKEYKAKLTMQALSKDQIGVPVNLEQMARLVDALSNNDEAVIAYALKPVDVEKAQTEAEKTKKEIRKVSLKMAAPVFNDFRECVRFSGFLHAKDKQAEKAPAKKA